MCYDRGVNAYIEKKKLQLHNNIKEFIAFWGLQVCLPTCA